MYLDEFNKISGIVVLLEFPDGFRELLIPEKHKQLLFNTATNIASRDDGVMKVREEVLPEIVRKKELVLSKSQFETFDNWLRKQNYLSLDDVVALRDMVEVFENPTDKKFATFTVVIGDNRPYGWWQDKVPFGFIIDKI